MSDEQTWTFVGHWDNDRIVVEYVVDGEYEDPREDTGFWEQGLWAASASGATMEEAQAAVIAEYEEDLHGPPPTRVVRFYNVRMASTYEVSAEDIDQVRELIEKGDDESLAKADDIICHQGLLVSTDDGDIDPSNEMLDFDILGD